MPDNTIWEKPEVKDLGEAKDLIRNVFNLGVGDTQPGMENTLEPS